MKQALKGKWPIFIALATACITMWANNINQVCLDAIYTEFQSANAFLQGYIVGGTSFVSLAFVLLTGVLAKKINKKLILMAALVLYLIGGVGGGFTQTMLQYAIFRTIMGAATGILGTIVFSIMFEYFPNPDDSAKIMGAYQLCNTLSGALISYLAGVLCVISWRTAQWINAGAILTLVCIAVMLPCAPKAVEGGEGWAEEGGSGRTKIDAARVVLTLIEAVLFIVLVSVFQFFVSVYLAERQIGDAALAGTLMSVATVTGAVINVVFAKLFEKLRRYTGVLFVLLWGVFSILLGFNVPAWVVIAAMCINGFGNVIVYSFYPIALNEYVPAKDITLCQSFFQATIYVGLFLTSYVPNLFGAIFGGGYQRLMLTSGIVTVVLCALVIVFIRTYMTKKPASAKA